MCKISLTIGQRKATNFLLESWKWIFSERNWTVYWLDKLCSYISIVMYNSQSIFSIMISIERYYAIVYPFVYAKKFTRKNICRIAVAIIFVSFLIWTPLNIGFLKLLFVNFKIFWKTFLNFAWNHCSRIFYPNHQSSRIFYPKNLPL